MPKKTFEQFKNEIMSKYQEYLDLKAKNDKTPEEVRRYYEDAYITNKALKEFVMQASKAIPETQRYDFLEKCVPEENRTSFNRLLERAVEDGYAKGEAIWNMIPDEKTKELIFLENHKESNIDYKMIALEALKALKTIPEEKKPQAYKKFYNDLASNAANMISTAENSYNVYLKFFDELEKQGADLDACVPDDDVFALPSEKPELYMKHTMDAAIKELISKTNDQAYKDILNDINDHILTQSTSVATDFTFPIAEDQAASLAHEDREAVYEEINADPLYHGKVVKTGNALYNYNIKIDTPEENKKYLDGIYSSKIKLSEKFVGDVKAIAAMLDEVCVYKGDAEKSEQGTKIYGMSGLLDKKNALKAAVESGDEAKIKAAYEAYKHTEEVYDNMMEIAKDMHEGYNMPGNVSVSRTSSFSMKYGNNPVAVSRISGVWQLWCLSKRTGISIDKMLSDPQKYMTDIAEKQGLHESKVNSYLKDTSPADFIADYTKNGSVLSLKASPDIATHGFINRGLELIQTCGADDEAQRIKNNATIEKLKYKVTEGYCNALSSIPGTMMLVGKEEVINRLIVLEKKDINILHLTDLSSSYKDPQTGKPYEAIDPVKYINSGKTTSDRVAYNLAKMINDFETNHKDIDKDLLYSSVKETTKMLLKANIAKDQTVNSFVSEIKAAAEQKKSIDVTKLPSYKAFRKEHLASNIAKDVENNNFSKASVMSSIKQIADYKAKYDNSWFFMKWFSSNTKEMLAMSNSIQAKLVEAGISEEMINNAKDFLKNKDNISFEATCNEIESENKVMGIDEIVKQQADIEIDEEAHDMDGMFEDDLNKSFELEKGKSLIDDSLDIE